MQNYVITPNGFKRPQLRMLLALEWRRWKAISTNCDGLSSFSRASIVYLGKQLLRNCISPRNPHSLTALTSYDQHHFFLKRFLLSENEWSLTKGTWSVSAHCKSWLNPLVLPNSSLLIDFTISQLLVGRYCCWKIDGAKIIAGCLYSLLIARMAVISSVYEMPQLISQSEGHASTCQQKLFWRVLDIRRHEWIFQNLLLAWVSQCLWKFENWREWFGAVNGMKWMRIGTFLLSSMVRLSRR